MSIMDGGRRKRKLENEEENEEEKMEKFFALIRSTKEVLEHINGERKKPNENKVIGWNLSFQPQDFMGPDARLNAININVPRGILLPGPSKKKEDEIKEGKDNFMVDAQLKTINVDQASLLLPGPSKKKEDDEKDKLAGDHGLDLDLKL